MPVLTIDGVPHDVPHGRRLVLAIADAGTNIGHRCGGKARCTTCRVEFVSGEPAAMTDAEATRLEEKDLSGVARLACQIRVTHDMSVRPLVRLEDEPNWQDAGPRPSEDVEPVPTYSSGVAALG